MLLRKGLVSDIGCYLKHCFKSISVSLYLDPNCLQRLSADDKSRHLQGKSKGVLTLDASV